MLQMIFQHSALFDGMPLISVVSTIQILISPRRVSPHFIWPPKLWLIFYPIHDPMHRLLKHHIHSPHMCPGFWILKSFWILDWKSPCSGWLMIGALPLFCCRSSSNLLYSSIRLINCLISLRGLLVSDSHSSESSGNPSRKVLTAIFSLPPLISV